MIINKVEFSASLEEILETLISEMRVEGIQYIQRTIPTHTHIQICCPYHSDGLERRPSAGLRRKDGLMHCFACGEVHTLPQVISHCFGREDNGNFGWNWLLKHFSSVSIVDRKPIELDYTREGEKTPAGEYVSEDELDKYRYEHPYWAKRKITDKKIIELFDLGFDPETKCITMPNRDIDGNCLFVAKRSVEYKYFNYPKGSSKPVYGLYELMSLMKQGVVIDEVAITESMIDALTCFQYGKYAVALNGLGTPEQFEALTMFPCRKYILATDMDEYGLKARKRIAVGLKNKIVTEYRWDIHIAKDINDMSKEYFDSLQEYFL